MKATPSRVALAAGPAVALAIGGAVWAADVGLAAAGTAGVAGLCAIWWVLEPVPIAATSLLPLTVFAVSGVRTPVELFEAYTHPLIILLLGGFVLSKGVESCGAHRRLAMAMLRATGGGEKRLVLGFMLASGLCSMWISNTATTLMLLPVALAVIPPDGSGRRLAVPLLLGVAYAASIGGIATPIGTPPNIVFMGAYEEHTGVTYSFLEWMKIGLPVSLVMLPLAWLYLTRGLSTTGDVPAMASVGPWRTSERRVAVVFGATVFLWVFRTEPLGGWSQVLAVQDYVTDSRIAIVAAGTLLVLPGGNGRRLLSLRAAVDIPWKLLLLFGGGIAIAGAFKSSGLSSALGELLASGTALPALVLTAIVALLVTFLTEITSNTATTTLLMPILAATADAAQLAPSALMIPATLSASCAFMLPVATAPNAIVFGVGHVPGPSMAREGLTLNFIGIAVVTGLTSILL